MKRIIIFALVLITATCTFAQPSKQRAKATKTAQKTTQTQKSSSLVTDRQKLQFPVSLAMPEDVVWRRDIYRELDLQEEENSPMYYPVEPNGKQMNVFTFIFRLALTNNLPVYQYRLDGNESFAAADKINVKEFLDNYSIFYEEKNGKITVDNSDIPSSEVLSYYIKECSYYDQNTSTFATKVLAICPVWHRADEFGAASVKYPLFWVQYTDLEPFLNRLTMMTSNYNNAAVMSAADYFTVHKYKGKIYKTNNMLGRTLSQYCPNDTAMRKEQARIEAELVAFEKTIYGDKARRDSLDSIANNKDKKTKKVKVAGEKTRRASTNESVTTKKAKPAKSSSASSGSRISVRRERH